MNKNCFCAADILLPKNQSMEKWAVVACDQFSSQPEYWARVRAATQGVPSSMHMILPEADLGTAREAEETEKINQNMQAYLESGVFTTYRSAYVYVERTLDSGLVRRGLVGMVDLDAYDYTPGSGSAIRATEGTVAARIPPRVRVRKNAPIELPHILMLADDHADLLLTPIAEKKQALDKVYDFDLMEQGGHITGYLVRGSDVTAFDARLSEYAAHIDEKYPDLDGAPMIFAVGDGNHSLATAKECYEQLKRANPGADLSAHPARYALVELENIHDPALAFEPIHRVVANTDPAQLLAALREQACAQTGFPLRWKSGSESGTVYLDPEKSPLAVGVLQKFLDGYLQNHPGTIDYIHDDEVLLSLAGQENTIGFLLPPMEKSQLFRGVIADGVLPRKTFSMGHAREKRYYLEGRAIK
ncbi:MAG: DUF1015 domain-containing protein [Oscillospiraceae bacterium]|nr:DUF1015 domain-containing protein [Oscillospiraceae bacterium]